MNELIAVLPDADELLITRHGESMSVFEPTAARCTCTTAPCCCCSS
jgi:ribosomally synthesized peptide (plantazolicin-class)